MAADIFSRFSAHMRRLWSEYRRYKAYKDLVADHRKAQIPEAYRMFIWHAAVAWQNHPTQPSRLAPVAIHIDPDASLERYAIFQVRNTVTDRKGYILLWAPPQNGDPWNSTLHLLWASPYLWEVYNMLSDAMDNPPDFISRNHAYLNRIDPLDVETYDEHDHEQEPAEDADARPPAPDREAQGA